MKSDLMDSAENANHEKGIFEQALDIESSEDRLDYLKAACGEDAALLARVQALLQANDSVERFLPGQPQNQATVAVSVTEKPGDRVGRYKLLEKLGEGGCGIVYVADQSEPVRRRVALKLIKPGMDSRQVIARFEAERQALALMDHPNIAKVLDAGNTETGRPYFVMELVRGIKITDYCDQNHLSTRQRLDLFVQVCQAVQHAHQKGIIHRDLKPSNILVTVNDGVPVPKVIDFGIAKATEGRLTDATVYTQLHQFIGTPAYMSPEQAAMTSLDVDTRSDIYSLGVLLYELLTGATPFDQKQLLAAGLDEMRRTIREVEPVKPSTRLTQDLVAVDVSPRKSNKGLKIPAQEEVSADARQRLRLKEQIARVRGDLDWIVMKCLEKDRARRYETANGLASDIQRHLNNEPVVACPPSNLYKFQKLVRRNKVMFAAGAGIATALVIGLAIALWQSIEKARAYHRAVAAEKAAQTEAQILKDMLASAGPEVAMGRDATLLLEILDKTAERIGKELANYPAVEMDLSGTIGNLYRNLGRFQKAEKFLRRALALREQNQPTANNADLLWGLGAVFFEQGKLPESEEFLRKALAAQRKFGREDANATDILCGLAKQFAKQAKLSEAKLLSTEALTLSRKLFAAPDERLAGVLNTVAEVEHADRKFQDAEAHHREAIAMWEKLGGHEYELHIARENLARTLSELGKLQEAESLYNEALAFTRKVFAKDSPEVASVLQDLARNLGEQDRLLEAESLYRESVEIGRKRFGNENPVMLGVLTGLGVILARESKLSDAASVLSEAVDLSRKNPGWGLQPQNFAYHHLGKVLADQGELVKAEAIQSEHLAFLRKRGPENWFMPVALAELAITLMTEHKFEQAEPITRECLTLYEQGSPEQRSPDAWRAFSARILLGECLLNQKRLAETEPLLIAGYEGIKQRSEVGWKARLHRRLPGERKALELLVRLHEETGHPDQATKWRQKLAELEKIEAQPKNVQSPK